MRRIEMKKSKSRYLYTIMSLCSIQTGYSWDGDGDREGWVKHTAEELIDAAGYFPVFSSKLKATKWCKANGVSPSRILKTEVFYRDSE
jgi:hypothetical protein